MEAADSWNWNKHHPPASQSLYPQEMGVLQLYLSVSNLASRSKKQSNAIETHLGKSLSPITIVTIQCLEDLPYINDEHINNSNNEHCLNKITTRTPFGDTTNHELLFSSTFKMQ